MDTTTFVLAAGATFTAGTTVHNLTTTTWFGALMGALTILNVAGLAAHRINCARKHPSTTRRRLTTHS